MSVPTYKWSYFITISLLIFLANLEIAAAQNKLTIGVFPRHNYAETIRMFLPLEKYLTNKLGMPVKIESARDFEHFWSNIETKKYDLVHVNQSQYLNAHKRFGYNILLKNEEFGQSTLRSIIVVRKDSGINSLNDLKNKKIIFGGNKTAMMSYLIPNKLLNDAGISKDKINVSFARNPPNALMAVYIKQADACGIGDAVLKLTKIKNNIDTDKIKIIAKSEAVPHLAWATAKSMSDALQKKVRMYLLALNDTSEGKKILSRARLTGLLPVAHQEYKGLGKYLQTGKDTKP